jgi:hypothetical protein
MHNGSNAGFMVLMPQVSQVEVVGLFLALRAWTDIGSSAGQGMSKVLIDSIDRRRKVVDEIIGVSNAWNLSYWRQLFETNTESIKHRTEITGPFRMMPDKEAFKHELSSWRKDIFGRYDEASLRDLASRISNKSK